MGEPLACFMKMLLEQRPISEYTLVVDNCASLPSYQTRATRHFRSKSQSSLPELSRWDSFPMQQHIAHSADQHQSQTMSAFYSPPDRPRRMTSFEERQEIECEYDYDCDETDTQTGELVERRLDQLFSPPRLPRRRGSASGGVQPMMTHRCDDSDDSAVSDSSSKEGTELDMYHASITPTDAVALPRPNDLRVRPVVLHETNQSCQVDRLPSASMHDDEQHFALKIQPERFLHRRHERPIVVWNRPIISTTLDDEGSNALKHQVGYQSRHKRHPDGSPDVEDGAALRNVTSKSA